jgi:heme-degrading monooxygenase HmoA
MGISKEADMLVVMVRIPVGAEEEGRRLEERFRNRAGLVDNMPGFLGFELLKGDGEYISTTRWANKEALDNWMRSQAHAQSHADMPNVPDAQSLSGMKPASNVASRTAAGHPHGGGGPQRTGPAASSVTVYEVVIPAEANS